MTKYSLLIIVFLLTGSVKSSYSQIFNKSSKEIQKAEDFINKKQYTDALKSLDVAIENSKGKDDYHIFYLKGYCEFSMNQFERAIEQFNYALSKVNSREVLPSKTDESVISALRYRAQSQEFLKNYTAAIKDLQLLASIKDNPILKSEAYQKWAEDIYIINVTRNHEKSELLVNKAIEVNPKNTAAMKFMAQLAINKKNHDYAIPILEKAVNLETDAFERSTIISLLALCKYKTGKNDDARRFFQEAVSVAPESYKWKIYQHQAELVIKNHLYDKEILEQASVWANRAAILSTECSTRLTLSYLQILTNKLAEASETIKDVDCDNPQLKLNSFIVKNLIGELSKAKTLPKLKVYGVNNWYYWGPIKSGLAEGKGSATSKNFLYEVKDASFSKDVMVHGKLTNLSDAWTYTGSFLNGVIQGNGNMSYDNGEIYSGKFVSGQPNGLGKWLYIDSSVYEGIVLNGKPNGLGVFKQKNGVTYNGQFKNGKPNGKGILTQNGKKENVEFTNGERSDAMYLASLKSEKAAQEESQNIAQQIQKDEELAKAEKRNKIGKVLGKTLILVGGAVALKEAADLGMDEKDIGELGAALLSDVISNGKDDNFINTLKQKNTLGSLSSNSILGNTANQAAISSLLRGKENSDGVSVTNTKNSLNENESTTSGSSEFTEGNYTTSDGRMTIEIKKEGSSLVLIDPYTTSKYTPVGKNTYSFTSPKTGTIYMAQVIDGTTIKTYKKGYESQSSLISFSGDSEKGATREENKKYFAIANKYKDMMKSDSKDAQLWSFCAAAANARASLNESGYQDYARKVSFSLKQILENPSKCPCEDAIELSIWKSTK